MKTGKTRSMNGRVFTQEEVAQRQIKLQELEAQQDHEAELREEMKQTTIDRKADKQEVKEAIVEEAGKIMQAQVQDKSEILLAIANLSGGASSSKD